MMVPAGREKATRFAMPKPAGRQKVSSDEESDMLSLARTKVPPGRVMLPPLKWVVMSPGRMMKAAWEDP